MMREEFPLTPRNRLRIAEAFQQNPRVDYSIDCVIEGQMGKAYVDSLEEPTAYQIVIGPFWYFAGRADTPGAEALIKSFPPYNLLMPSPPAWINLAKQVFADRLVPFTRYSFSSDHLVPGQLQALLEASPHIRSLVPLDAGLAAKVCAQPDSYLDLSDFDSLEDFAERGIGFAVREGEEVLGVAYSSLVCSRGIEVSIYVEENHRRKGVAAAVGSRLVLSALQRGLRPNWDAANPESCALAEKLGFQPTGAYQAYFYRG